MGQMASSVDDPSNNRSLLRALRLLTSFGFEKRDMGLTELAKMSGLSKATVYRLASTLVLCRFLAYDDVSKRYSLGPTLFELGSMVSASFSIRKIAAPYLDRLYAKLGKVVFLAILQDGELLYIDKREDMTSAVRFSTEVGRRRPPHFGMLGQVLMAFLSDTEVDKLLKASPLLPLTHKSITDPMLFKRKLEKIRQEGFAVDEGEVTDITSGIAVPVRDFTGKVIAALGVGFFSSSVDFQATRELVGQAFETAAQISRDLGYSHAADQHQILPIDTS
jgi:IclR family transcriptional regulator, KDG regulon repressor